MPVTDILDKFPYKKFNLKSNYLIHATIKEVNKKLSTNTSAIHSTLSDGRHGLLSLTLPLAIYNTITNIPFIRLLNQGS